jgi:hypothetical protein
MRAEASSLGLRRSGRLPRSPQSLTSEFFEAYGQARQGDRTSGPPGGGGPLRPSRDWPRSRGLCLYDTSAALDRDGQEPPAGISTLSAQGSAHKLTELTAYKDLEQAEATKSGQERTFRRSRGSTASWWSSP